MPGMLRAVVNGEPPQEDLARLRDLARELEEQGIRFMFESGDPDAAPSIHLSISDTGSISHRHIESLLSTLFASGTRRPSYIISLTDEDRVFDLPADGPECIDWFRDDCGS